MERSPFAELYRRGAMKVMYIALVVFVVAQLWAKAIPLGFWLIGFWLVAGLFSTLAIGIVNGFYSAKLDAGLTVRRISNPNALAILPHERLFGLATLFVSAIVTTTICFLVKGWIY